MIMKAMGGKVLGKGGMKALGGAAKAGNAASQTAGGANQIQSARQGNNNMNQSFNNKKTPQLQQQQQNLTKVSHRVHKTYDDMKKIASFGESVGKGIGYAGATALGAAGAGALVRGASNMKKKMDTEKMWDKLKDRRPDLTKTEKDRENFEVLQQFSPSIASNITTLETYMDRVKRQNMMPHEFVSDLTSAQKDIDQGSFGRNVEDGIPRSVQKGMEMGQKDTMRKNSSLNSFRIPPTEKRTNELDSIEPINQYVKRPKGEFKKSPFSDTRTRLKTAMLKVDREIGNV